MEISSIILSLFFAAIVGYLCMINIIYYLAPTFPKDSFPTKKFGKNNCTRIADNPNRGKGMEPLVTYYSIEEVQANVKKIIMDMPRTKIVTDKNGFMHFVQITPLFLSLIHI